MKSIVGTAVSVLGFVSIGLAAAYAFDFGPVRSLLGSVSRETVYAAPVVLFTVPSMLNYFVIKPMNYARLLKKGFRGVGTIISISETGTRINNRPLCKIELEIEVPNQAKYRATIKSVISFLQSSQLTPGSKVGVLVDPKDFQNVVFIKEGDASSHSVINQSSVDTTEIERQLAELDRSNREIIAKGTKSKAIVTKYIPMNINVNGANPVATLELRIMPEHEPAFTGTAKGCLMGSRVHLFQPGEEIYVRFDPNDRSRVSIEHS